MKADRIVRQSLGYGVDLQATVVDCGCDGGKEGDCDGVSEGGCACEGGKEGGCDGGCCGEISKAEKSKMTERNKREEEK